MPPHPIPAPRESGYTASTPIPLYWCRYGPVGAPRLVILHGGPGAHHDYLLPQFLELARTHDCLFYDQRGGGRSKTDDRTPITWRTQVDDLARVLYELGEPAPVLVGYSWGGLLALLYAIESVHGALAPRPSRLALVDPAPVTRAFRQQFEDDFAARQRAPAIQALRDALATSGLRERDPDAHKQRAFELSVAGYFADPAQATDLTPFRVTGRVQTSIWESLGDYNLLPSLATVRLPTLIVHGRQDPIPLASSEAAAKAMGATLVPLEGCGHVPYVEARDALFASLGSFLAPSPARDA
jgi:proline iminopeptidase